MGKIILALSLMSTGVAFSSPPASIATLLKQMTLEEKIRLLGGTGFATQSLPHLNVSPMEMTDGPHGVRFGHGTAWPSGMALAATFNSNLAYVEGQGIGEEARAHGKNLLLGPTINMARTPWGGRVFESFGEDPYLSGQLAASYISGVQSQGVGACVKHFAVNNRENGRSEVDIQVSERALQEIYLPAFKKAVDAGVVSVMAAYNKINGSYAAENSYLLNDVLKKQWGFNGFVVSDWGATHSTVPSALNGLDLEMPTAEFFGDKLLDAVKKGEVPEQFVDDKVRRLLTGLKALGLLEPAKASPSARSEHPDRALQVATESLVLLKNENILPLQIQRPLKLAVLGPSASIPRIGGGGSSMVHRQKNISALDGLTKRVSERNLSVDIYSQIERVPLAGDPLPHPDIFFTNGTPGFEAQYFSGPDLAGPPQISRQEKSLDFDWEWGGPGAPLGSENFSARYTSTLIPRESGDHEFVAVYDDGVRVYVDNNLIIDGWTSKSQQPPLGEQRASLNLNQSQKYDVTIEYQQRDSLAYFQLGVIEPSFSVNYDESAIKDADAVLVFVGNSPKTETESYDRATLRLTTSQEKLIQDVSALNSNVVVVIQAGSPIEMGSWIDKVKGVVMAWYPGSEGGLAIADVLLGLANPSGRLPVTFPAQWKDSSASSTYDSHSKVENYSDGIFMGYRHFDKNGITPQFPFGFGLSYSKFASKIKSVKTQTDLSTSPQFEIEVEVENQGAMAGSYVVPVYVSSVGASKVERALKELKGFTKIALNPGEKKTVWFSLSEDAFHYFDEASHSWKVEPGPYRISIEDETGVFTDQRTITLK